MSLPKKVWNFFKFFFFCKIILGVSEWTKNIWNLFLHIKKLERIYFEHLWVWNRVAIQKLNDNFIVKAFTTLCLEGFTKIYFSRVLKLSLCLKQLTSIKDRKLQPLSDYILSLMNHFTPLLLLCFLCMWP